GVFFVVLGVPRRRISCRKQWEGRGIDSKQRYQYKGCGGSGYPFQVLAAGRSYFRYHSHFGSPFSMVHRGILQACALLLRAFPYYPSRLLSIDTHKNRPISEYRVHAASVCTKTRVIAQARAKYIMDEGRQNAYKCASRLCA